MTSMEDSRKRVYYKLVAMHPEVDSVKDQYKGKLTYEEVEPFLKTRKVPGFWSFGPHDWGESDVAVDIVKVTEEVV